MQRLWKAVFLGVIAVSCFSLGNSQQQHESAATMMIQDASIERSEMETND